jgi:DNA repair protein RecO (recombination protein O)
MKSSEALLLRKRPYGDADYVITLFTREFGKISAFARNAKSSRKRFGGRLEPFVHFLARFRERPGDMKFLEDLETIEVFRHLMEDLELFMWGSFITESAEILLPKESPNEEMFNLFVDTLRSSTAEERHAARARVPAETLSLSGYGRASTHALNAGK